MFDLLDELLAITGRLDEAGIPNAVVGGLAYSIYVEPRATEDLDLLIRPEDWERCCSLLGVHGWQSLSDPMDFRTVKIRRLTKMDGPDSLTADFILAEDQVLRDGLANRVGIRLPAGTLYLAPPETLIAMKQQRLSAKDRGDIEGLRRLLGEQSDQS